MSVSKWSYEPEKCDGDFCPGACDRCDKADEGFPIWAIIAALKAATKPGDVNEDGREIEQDGWITRLENMK